MVDAVDLFLGEMPREGGVEFPGRGQVAAERLFHDDAAVPRGDAVFVQPVGQRPEEAGRDRKVEGADHILAHEAGKLGPASGSGRVHRDIVDAVEKRVEHGLVAPAIGDRLGDGGADHRAIVSGRQVRSRGADDPGLGGHLAIGEAPEKARQDLLLGKIASPTEDDEVEGIDRNDARDHGSSGSLALTDRMPAL